MALILFNLILAPLVWERFAADPAWLSIMAGGLASGAMVASALVSPLASRIGTRRSLLVGIAGQSLCFAALWWIDQALTMLLLAGALGAFNTISWTTAVTAVQLDAPPAVRGRLAMARNALTAAVVAPLVPLVAAVSRQFSPSAPLLLASGLCAIFVMIAVLSTRRSDRRSCAAVEPSKAV